MPVVVDDLLAYVVAVTALTVSVGLASWLPARRAAQAPPMEILREG
jgi:ABC-type lipoprotein release transport system permease subunit